MSTGLMTLAYLGEMALVFNLAYLELSKSRYLKVPQDSIANLRATIGNEPDGSDKNKWTVGTTKLVDRLRDMTSDSRAERQKAWYVTGNHADGDELLVHSDWLACDGYDIFTKEKDKRLCENALILSGILLIGITLLDKVGWGERDFANMQCIALMMFFFSIFLYFGRHLYVKIRKWMVGAPALLGFAAFSASAYAGSMQALDSLFPVSVWWFCFSLFSLVLLAPVVCIAIGRRVRDGLNASVNDAKREFEKLKEQPLPKI